MTFIETENLNLRVPSKENLSQWSKWINSPFLRKTIPTILLPKTVDMQWSWIENELKSNNRILLEICSKINNSFLGVVSLSNIDYKKRSAQIATISPIQKSLKDRFCVYEARRALVNYSFIELSISKVYGDMIYPENESFLVNNMCIGFEIEGITHNFIWHNNEPKIAVNYFLTDTIFKKKKIMKYGLSDLLDKKFRNQNKKKLSNIVSSLLIDEHK